MVIDLLRSRVALEAEVLVLRQQINVLRRTRPRRPPFISIDRLILGGVCRLFPKMYDALAIVRPDTVIRWHRAGFRSYWRWKSRHRCGSTGCAVKNSPSVQAVGSSKGVSFLATATRLFGANDTVRLYSLGRLATWRDHFGFIGSNIGLRAGASEAAPRTTASRCTTLRRPEPKLKGAPMQIALMPTYEVLA